MLYQAVRDRDYKRATKMARAGANVNQVVGHGWTPIVSAVVARDRRMVEVLLQLGAKPALGIQAETGALTFACGRDADSVATMKALIEHGVPPIVSFTQPPRPELSARCANCSRVAPTRIFWIS